MKRPTHDSRNVYLMTIRASRRCELFLPIFIHWRKVPSISTA